MLYIASFISAKNLPLLFLPYKMSSSFREESTNYAIMPRVIGAIRSELLNLSLSSDKFARI